VPAIAHFLSLGGSFALLGKLDRAGQAVAEARQTAHFLLDQKGA